MSLTLELRATEGRVPEDADLPAFKTYITEEFAAIGADYANLVVEGPTTEPAPAGVAGVPEVTQWVIDNIGLIAGYATVIQLLVVSANAAVRRFLHQPKPAADDSDKYPGPSVHIEINIKNTERVTLILPTDELTLTRAIEHLIEGADKPTDG